MGELLKGLYEDLLEFDDVPDSAAPKDPVVKTESQQVTEAISRVTGSHILEQAEPEYSARKQQRTVPFRPVHPVKPLPEVRVFVDCVHCSFYV